VLFKMTRLYCFYGNGNTIKDGFIRILMGKKNIFEGQTGMVIGSWNIIRNKHKGTNAVNFSESESDGGGEDDEEKVIKKEVMASKPSSQKLLTIVYASNSLIYNCIENHGNNNVISYCGINNGENCKIYECDTNNAVSVTFYNNLS